MSYHTVMITKRFVVVEPSNKFLPNFMMLYRWIIGFSLNQKYEMHKTNKGNFWQWWLQLLCNDPSHGIIFQKGYHKMKKDCERSTEMVY